MKKQKRKTLNPRCEKEIIMKNTSLNVAKEEFKFIIERYINPLFHITGNIKYNENSVNNNNLIEILKIKNSDASTVKIYPGISDKKNCSLFYCEFKAYSAENSKKCAVEVLKELLKVTENNCLKLIKQRNYGNRKTRIDTYKNRTLDLAYELGICKWLTNTDSNAAVLHKIISRMIDWSSRTYEGKNVPFGIVIDFDASCQNASANYVTFLENDSSAVFTDGVFSGIMLDKNGDVLDFLTRDTKVALTNSSVEIFVPFQFADIAQHCKQNRIGIITLANGEIILVKNQEICFAKRGYKWIPFDWGKILCSLRPYFLSAGETDEKDITDKIKKIYCTLLDVSFAHTGGCLALILPSEVKFVDEKIKERIDLYDEANELANVSKESLEKIKILRSILACGNNKVRSFFQISKPLRKEIMGLDGATVLALNGDFYCAGSIVSVPGGSSGGGRTAASKKLAEYGVGIKISEDGYIEAYGKPLNNSDKNKRMVPVFNFK